MKGVAARRKAGEKVKGEGFRRAAGSQPDRLAHQNGAFYHERIRRLAVADFKARDLGGRIRLRETAKGPAQQGVRSRAGSACGPRGPGHRVAAGASRALCYLLL